MEGLLRLRWSILDNSYTMTLERVIIVNDFAFINGGQSKVAIDSALLLAEAGIDVQFFAAVGPQDPALDHPKIRTEIIGQYDILADPSRVNAALRGVWNKEAQRRLRALCESFDPTTTILHCHGYAKALSPSIGPVLTDGPIRSIYTMHEYFLACPNGGFYDYQRNEICTRRALSTSCLTTNCDVRHPAHKAWRSLRQIVTWGPAGIPRKMRDIVYISETQRLAMAPYLSGETRLHHVPNPIALPVEDPVDATNNKIYLFVGRLNPEKGGLMFAEAARNAKVPAVFVGDGVEADAIRKVNPDAQILGWQSPEEVVKWMRKARALVFPSLWYEGQPLVPLEALAQNVPVICGDWSAAAEAVDHQNNGIVYHAPTVSDLSLAILECKDLIFSQNPDHLFEMLPQTHLKRLLELYDRVLKEY